MNVYYNSESKKVYLVPDHYGRSLEYVKETIDWAKKNGMTIPEDSEIQFEVLRGNTHGRMLSIEFKSKTKPSCEFIDLQEYPHMSKNLVY